MNVLLAINSSAGTGHADALGSDLAAILRKRLGREGRVALKRSSGHEAVRESARQFARRHESDAVIIAGGGGGTLRAVIEGVGGAETPGVLPDNNPVRISALRMGSGNVIARQLGVAADPIEGAEELAGQLLRGATARCCVMSCETAHSSGLIYGATLGGFGLFGQVPRSLEVYHGQHPKWHRFTAQALGIERLTDVEYGLCLAGLCGKTAWRPGRLDAVEVRQGDRTETFRLLAGALMNFPLAALPFQPGVTVEDPELSLHLIPYRSRLQALGLVPRAKAMAREAKIFRITRDAPVTLRVINGERMPFFIDEDPLAASQLTLRMAGSLTFVPGKNFKPKTS